MASTRPASDSGRHAYSSRVPVARPFTKAVHGIPLSGASTTVHPVAPRSSVAWPTRTPRTSVMEGVMVLLWGPWRGRQAAAWSGRVRRARDGLLDARPSHSLRHMKPTKAPLSVLVVDDDDG